MQEMIGRDLAPKLIRTLIDNTPVAYIILDDQYRIHYINENFLKLRNLSPEATIGEICYNISNGGVHCRQCAVERALATGRKAFISRKDTLPGGAVRFIDDYAIPLTHGRGEGERYVLEIMVNRTQEMQARERRDADYDEILSILSTLLEAKDRYTAMHSEGVRTAAVKLARAMGLSPEEIFEISIAASLHDIGKVRVPDAIINKPGKLTDEEFAIIKHHPVASYDMLRDLSSFDNVKNIVRHHHERVDGRGYPDGLAGGQLSIGAKIVAVADTYDAITSTRSYRKALSHEYALEEIARAAGSQLDESAVAAFLAMDFDGDGTASRALDGETKPVERVIGAQSVRSEQRSFDKGDFVQALDQDRLLEEIFDNTPCGYVLMDKGRKVLYASRYFLEYMGLSQEDVLGKLCYEAGGVGSVPCPGCAIERALETGKVEYMRQEQDTNNGRKIFDLFGMPLGADEQGMEHVIEVIIDRTDEILMERRREQDFGKLIGMMGELLEEQKADAEGELSEKIAALRERLSELMRET